MLNYVVRAVLARWHPLLLSDASVSPIEHESRWSSADELRRTLNDVMAQMIDYANLLAEITNVPHTLQRSSNLSRARGFRDRSAADRPSMNHRSERRTFGVRAVTA